MTAVQPGTARVPADIFRDTLLSHGFDLFSGVPCSYLGTLLSLFEREDPARYVAAANEGSALAIACGAALAGRRSAVLLQNSGLGNLVNPLSSLAATFEIPVLLLIGYRGDPENAPDEPQHRLMGAATEKILDAFGIAHWRLPRTSAEAVEVLQTACAHVADGRTAAILIGKDAIGAAQRPGRDGGDRTDDTAIPPADVFATLTGLLSDELVVGTTGYTSRRLFACGDRPGNFYMQGSMGHAMSIGLGLALSRPDRRIVVADGDGAAIMHLGAMSTVGARAPGNFTHLILDNGRYESTGGQPVGARPEFAAAALANGYRHAARCDRAEDLPEALTEALRRTGPTLLHVLVGVGGDAPPRATASVSPQELRARFASVAALPTTHPIDRPTVSVAEPRS